MKDGRISKQLRQAVREELATGVSLRQLAREAGLTHVSLLRWARGDQDLFLSAADGLAKRLGIECRRKPKAPNRRK